MEYKSTSQEDKVYKDIKSEFESFIQSSNLHELLSELTQRCFENKAANPKAFIANYLTKNQKPNEVELKYKAKYKVLKAELAAVKRELEEIKTKPKSSVTKGEKVPVSARRKPKQDEEKAPGAYCKKKRVEPPQDDCPQFVIYSSGEESILGH